MVVLLLTLYFEVQVLSQVVSEKNFFIQMCDFTTLLNTFLVLIALTFYTLKNHTLERVSDFLFNQSWPLYSHRVNYFQSTFYVTDIVVSILSN